MLDSSILFIGGIVLAVLLGPWLLLWRTSFTRRRERKEDQARLRDLTSRFYALELEVLKLHAQHSNVGTDEAGPKTAEAPIPVTPAPLIFSPVVDSQVAPTPVVTLADESSLAAKVVEDWVTQKATGRGAADSSATSFAADSANAPTGTPPPPPSFAEEKAGPSLGDRLKSSFDLEEMMGTNWLNKIGIIILVLGIAFFLSYQLKTLGPAGKVLVGLATAAVLLGAGIWFDKKDQYRVLARAGIGGGWALTFFTAYAMYHVPAAQVLSSQVVDLMLMLAVAAAMVAHTLRYRSQVVTGLAFLLAFLTVSISHSNVYSLSAGAVLAAGFVIVVGRMRWFELEVFGILASYFNHYLWLRPIIEPMHGKRHPFPEFVASAGILLLYWVIFRVSYVFRETNNNRQERVSTAAALSNTALLLALFKYQSTHPEWAFWALLAIGAVETLLGQLPATRRRRSAVIVLSTLGVVLLIAAFPFRYSGMHLSVLWLLEIEALLLIGVRTKEVVFRRLGMLGALLVAGQMIVVDAAPIFGRRMDGADLRPDFARAIVFVVAAAVFYANAHWVLRRWADLFTRPIAWPVDQRVMQRLSYVGALMLLIAAWIAFPESWTAVAWCAVGMGLTLAQRRFNSLVPSSQETTYPELRYQAYFLALVSVFRAWMINLEAAERYHGLTVRLLTITLVSALLYATSRWGRGAANNHGVTIGKWFWSHGQLAGGAYTWSASLLLGLLAWYELRPVSVADGWLVGGLVLFEIGLTRNKLSLRGQGYAALAAGFLRIFYVNLNAAGNPGEISPRVYSVVPLALGFFYVYWRLQESFAHVDENDVLETERKFGIAEICCWMGTLAFAALLRFEVDADWVAGAWATLVFALLTVAWRSGRRVFLYQGMMIAVAVFFRTSLHNFYERSYFPPPASASRWITAGSAIALLLASLPFAFQIRKQTEESSKSGFARFLQLVARRPEQPLFFIAIGLLTALLAMEMRHGMVTLSWGLEGLAVFVLALWLGERSFRLTGLGLLLLCVGKILLVDVWRLDPQDRYLTFIVLGAALLLVSFLYTKNREALRQYL